MKNILAFMLFALVVLPGGSPFAQPSNEKLDKFMVRKMKKARLVGLQAAYLSKGELAWVGSYGLKNNVDISTADSSAIYGMILDDTIRDYSKNKLRASYINIPLMLEFNTSDDNDKSFHVAAGVVGGWKMGSITKQKWEDDNEKYQARRKSDFNLNPFTLDATARIGYKNLTVFATYGLTPLFQKDKEMCFYMQYPTHLHCRHSFRW